MKRITSILMSVIATLALINGLAIANTQNGSEFKNYNGYSVYDLKAETITTASYNTYKFSQIAQYKQVDFIVSASSGTITTANVDWCLEDGTIIASETLTSGTGLSNFKAPLLILKIYNQVAAPVTITGAIMFTDNPLRTITVAGTVAVNNLPAIQTIAGQVTINSMPAVNNTIQNAIVTSDIGLVKYTSFTQLVTPGITTTIDVTGYSTHTIVYKVSTISTNVVVRLEGSIDNVNWFNMSDAGTDTTKTSNGVYVAYKYSFKMKYFRFNYVSCSGLGATIDVAYLGGN